MRKILWRPKTLQINWDKFREAIPNGVEYLLHCIIDRLQPVQFDSSGAFFPMEFGGAFRDYIQFLVDEGVAQPELCGKNHMITARYKDGEFHTASFPKQLVMVVDGWIEAAELSSGKIIIGNARETSDSAW
jgi:hypothetical protein